ncbi:MAG TPA: hypothetical protein PLJ21_09930 [Pseudobdellovibrionaceae bacterium]|nr:hypothetical protein [Pseudobdellovibrionaceae bacterium]
MWGEGDWSIKEVSQHNCQDCKHLSKFLLSSTDQKMVWPLAKQRRQHIHDVIDGLDIPVSHTTLREGSPQKLVLTKNGAALLEREKTYLVTATQGLAKLKSLF